MDHLSSSPQLCQNRRVWLRHNPEAPQRGKAAAEAVTAEYAKHAEREPASLAIPRIPRIPRFSPSLKPANPMNRKSDGRSQLNRLSRDRQAAVTEHAARHTLPETVDWLKNPGWHPEPRAASQTSAPASPSPPAQPQGISVSRWALSRWLAGYRMREQCAENRHTVAALVRDLRAANPAWTPDEVHKAAQAFFEALALHRQETRLWALIQRLDFRRAQLELTTARHEATLRSKLSMGLDQIAEAFRENPEAFNFYNQARQLLGPDCVQQDKPQTTNTR